MIHLKDSLTTQEPKLGRLGLPGIFSSLTPHQVETPGGQNTPTAPRQAELGMKMGRKKVIMMDRHFPLNLEAYIALIPLKITTYNCVEEKKS